MLDSAATWRRPTPAAVILGSQAAPPATSPGRTLRQAQTWQRQHEARHEYVSTHSVRRAPRQRARKWSARSEDVTGPRESEWVSGLRHGGQVGGSLCRSVRTQVCGVDRKTTAQHRAEKLLIVPKLCDHAVLPRGTEYVFRAATLSSGCPEFQALRRELSIQKQCGRGRIVRRHGEQEPRAHLESKAAMMRRELLAAHVRRSET